MYSKNDTCSDWMSCSKGDYGMEIAIDARHAYYGLMSHVDHWIGEVCGVDYNKLRKQKLLQIVKMLKKRGWFNETLIIFASDHGDQLNDHFLWYETCECKFFLCNSSLQAQVLSITKLRPHSIIYGGFILFIYLSHSPQNRRGLLSSTVLLVAENPWSSAICCQPLLRLQAFLISAIATTFVVDRCSVW